MREGRTVAASTPDRQPQPDRTRAPDGRPRPRLDLRGLHPRRRQARRARAVRSTLARAPDGARRLVRSCIAARSSASAAWSAPGARRPSRRSSACARAPAARCSIEGKPFAPRSPVEAIRAGHRLRRRGSAPAVHRAGPFRARESAARPSRRASRLRPRLRQAGKENRRTDGAARIAARPAVRAQSAELLRRHAAEDHHRAMAACWSRRC